jgi:hypothetical protein
MAKRKQNADEEEVPQEQEPPRKINKKFKGQIKQYNFFKTVKSLEELDKFRFEV